MTTAIHYTIEKVELNAMTLQADVLYIFDFVLISYNAIQGRPLHFASVRLVLLFYFPMILMSVVTKRSQPN